MPTLCHITTPLPEGTLRLQTCSAHESLSTLGEITISALATDPNISPDTLLGKPVTIAATLRDNTQRELSGHVTRFAQSGTEGAYYAYQMTVRPWLWLLTRTADCRIFQEQTVPEIIMAVFEDHPVARFEFRLFRQYRKWNYCVQYRETDFNFVARLLEHEGIYWYFEHQGGKHKLILVDSASAHDSVPGHASLPFYGNAGQLPPDLDYVHHWAASREVESGHVVLTDYDFERPSSSLTVAQAQTRSYDLSDAEVFDFPGGYTQIADGSQYAESRIDELQSGYQIFHGSANTVGLRVGHTLGITHHPRDDQNAHYLLTRTHIQIRHSGYEAGSSAAVFHCDFNALSATQQYRPPRHTPKPCVQGPQSAVVVGPPGQEIFTDQYGRVKVQFHWDRRGQKNTNSSCWLRVSSPWAGSSYGAVHIPRIGHEVIVGFLEGDPDAPLVIGRVNNAHNLPNTFSGTGSLPGNQALAGYKSKEIGGSGYNQLLFDDTTGQVRTQIASAEGASQLNLGWLVHPRADQAGSDTPSAQARGRGFELRTDAWGALRAGSGLLLTTEKRTAAAGSHADAQELTSQLNGSLAQAKEMSQAAQSHNAHGLDANDDLAKLHTISHQRAKQGLAEVAGASEPVLAMHGAAGMTLSSQSTVALAAGNSLHFSSALHTNFSVGRRLAIAVGEAFSVFVQRAGIKLIAGKGKLELQAHDDEIEAIAKRSVKLNSVDANVEVFAGKQILLTAGGGYIRIADGNIEIHAPGKISIKGASYAFTGPTSLVKSLPQLPKSSSKADERFKLVDQVTGEALKGVPYKITTESGKVIQGKTDDQGMTSLVQTDIPEKLSIQVLPQ